MPDRIIAGVDVRMEFGFRLRAMTIDARTLMPGMRRAMLLAPQAMVIS